MHTISSQQPVFVRYWFAWNQKRDLLKNPTFSFPFYLNLTGKINLYTTKSKICELIISISKEHSSTAAVRRRGGNGINQNVLKILKLMGKLHASRYIIGCVFWCNVYRRSFLGQFIFISPKELIGNSNNVNGNAKTEVGVIGERDKYAKNIKL